jgi:predicted nucleic acid-binding protein
VTFADLQKGDLVFLDANTLVYHFQPHSTLGQVCTDLLERIEHQELVGSTSTYILTEVAHRLMVLEACTLNGWSLAGTTGRLQKYPDKVRPLTRFRQALQEIPRYRIQVLTIPASLIDSAAHISQQTGLLSNDALTVSVMQGNGLTNLASHDSDFDRVPGITRYAPA